MLWNDGSQTWRTEHVGVRNGMDRPSGISLSASERGRMARAEGRRVERVAFRHVDILGVGDGGS